VFFFFLISPPLVSLPFPGVINDLNYFLTPIDFQFSHGRIGD
jgi:hypothetical protein